MKITVFTPSYNRAHTLPRLYESLKRQTSEDFCWLIVDDGSTDHTNALVSKWSAEGAVTIEYHYQNNQGKSMAHNCGAALTKTELFVCVDSDDYLADRAVEEIIDCWEKSQDKDVGILAFKATEDGPVTRIVSGGNGRRTTLKNAYDHLGLVGDTMLVFRTQVLQKYCFPQFEGEKFVPEAYLYDLIDQDGPMILLEKPLYICEYLDDGYSNNMAKLLKNNPCGYLAYIKQRLMIDRSIKDRFLDSVRYVAMAKVHNERIIRDAVYPFYALLAYPAGWVFYKKRYAKYADK